MRSAVNGRDPTSFNANVIRRPYPDQMVLASCRIGAILTVTGGVQRMRRLGWEPLMRARAVSSGSGTSSSTQPQRVGLMVNFDPSSCQISSAPPSITLYLSPSLNSSNGSDLYP